MEIVTVEATCQALMFKINNIQSTNKNLTFVCTKYGCRFKGSRGEDAYISIQINKSKIIFRVEEVEDKEKINRS